MIAWAAMSSDPGKTMADHLVTTMAAARADDEAKHIVDVLIEERAPRLAGGPFWPLARPALYQALNYKTARAMADAIAPLGGRAALDHVSRILDLKVRDRFLAERLPANGRCVIVANHPTGIADGVAVYDAVKRTRPDVCFFANADAHRVCPGFIDVLIPVEWVTAKRTIEKTKRTLRMANQAFNEERPVMIFPAGRLARMENGQATDPDWEPSAVSMARKNKAPIIPIHVQGPYPFLFHTFDKFSKELRDITLFHELLNKKGQGYDLIVGPPIPPEQLAGDAEDTTLKLKRYVERQLPDDPDTPFSM
jgi:putative hemolysin